ncbi:hypothetical protein HOY82DRAFT_609535 [Tuber indicum]|nr:hypothetical protein HOY82DRAFT_609535 [Tuber indicum]
MEFDIIFVSSASHVIGIYRTEEVGEQDDFKRDLRHWYRGIITQISDKKHQAGTPFADNVWFSGNLASLPEHLAALPGYLAALPGYLTALPGVAPRLDPAVALAPTGFGGRPEFSPDWPRLFKITAGLAAWDH